MQGAIEQSLAMVVERVEDGGDKEKKKNKRRSNRRSKQNSPNPVTGAAPSPVNEIGGESSQSLGNGSKTKSYMSSINGSFSRQLELDVPPSSGQEPTTASNIPFNSMPAMHISGQVEYPLPSDCSRSLFSRSCPEPVTGGPIGACANKDLLPFNQIYGHGQTKIFYPHWSMEAVDKALVKGDVFKAFFRVNAHNRLEAYCTIEGVPTDVLISGIAAQNRAVEGDVVAIKVDPLAFWTKMKGSNGSPNNSSSAEDCNTLLESSETASINCKGKCKVAVSEYSNCTSSLQPLKEFHHGHGTYTADAVHQELGSSVGYNGCYPQASDFSLDASYMGQNEVSGVQKICAMISLYPSKRPTGRVVAIIERSPRRDTIVGFLNVKQWLYYRRGYKKDAKKNKSSSSLNSDQEYIQLTPNDPKFPKMMVPVSGLPISIMERLEDGDVTVEMELVAAQLDNWAEEAPFPQACVSRIFGRGSEMESQINAILYENAICCSDFSPESLSCLPPNTWEVPPEELHCRRDLRSMCIFTIDPSTAIDLDDALSVERLPNGNFRVGVHIADASYFVRPDTALDNEAQIRSNTVYMLKRKLAMLPPLLSENLGSLNPGVDRLAFSIFWDLNSIGDVTDRWIGRTVVRSCCKLSYEHAQSIIDGTVHEDAINNFGDGLPQFHGNFEWSDVIRSINDLHEVSKTLRLRRFGDGALQLDNPKVFFLFDESGVPYDSLFCKQKDSNFLVEEFMLLANRTAAEVISRAFPDSALLRRHPEPNMRKLRELEAFCCKHGLELDASSSGHFHCSLELIREKLKDDAMLFDILINYAARPMQLATYFCTGDFKENKDDWSHYALALPLYTHFTSPLRRYPDIVVHRTLAAVLEAEELCMNLRRVSRKVRQGEEVTRCFTGICFDKDAAESLEGREVLAVAASKHRVPCTELLSDVAAYCNDRKLASRHVKDACDRLYTWVLLKRREVLLSEARVLGIGPRFMSIYVQKLAIERRLYYDEVEGLTAEWLETTSTLVLSLCTNKRTLRRSGSGYHRVLDEVAWVINPYDLKAEPEILRENGNECSAKHLGVDERAAQHFDPVLKSEIEPSVFPITVRLLSTIPVALHAVGGDDGPLDIGVRLFISSYFT